MICNINEVGSSGPRIQRKLSGQNHTWAEFQYKWSINWAKQGGKGIHNKSHCSTVINLVKKKKSERWKADTSLSKEAGFSACLSLFFVCSPLLS